jgi:hypothetical protein
MHLLDYNLRPLTNFHLLSFRTFYLCIIYYAILLPFLLETFKKMSAHYITSNINYL